MRGAVQLDGEGGGGAGAPRAWTLLIILVAFHPKVGEIALSPTESAHIASSAEGVTHLSKLGVQAGIKRTIIVALAQAPIGTVESLFLAPKSIKAGTFVVTVAIALKPFLAVKSFHVVIIMIVIVTRMSAR